MHYEEQQQVVAHALSLAHKPRGQNSASAGRLDHLQDRNYSPDLRTYLARPVSTDNWDSCMIVGWQVDENYLTATQKFCNPVAIEPLLGALYVNTAHFYLQKLILYGTVR
jgi:hypothetical protein